MDDLKERLAPILARHPEVELAMLFGSQARGTARPDSDVDVAVEGENIDVLGLAAELRHAVGRDVDVVELRHAGYPLLKALLHQGKTIFARPGAEGAWRSQAISRVELDRPWFERMRDGFLRKLAEGAHG